MRSYAASSMTPSWYQTVLAPMAAASSATGPARSLLTNTDDVDFEGGSLPGRGIPIHRGPSRLSGARARCACTPRPRERQVAGVLNPDVRGTPPRRRRARGRVVHHQPGTEHVHRRGPRSRPRRVAGPRRRRQAHELTRGASGSPCPRPLGAGLRPKRASRVSARPGATGGGRAVAGPRAGSARQDRRPGSGSSASCCRTRRRQRPAPSRLPVCGCGRLQEGVWGPVVRRTMARYSAVGAGASGSGGMSVPGVE